MTMKIKRAITRQYKVTQTLEVLMLRREPRNTSRNRCWQCDGELSTEITIAFTKLGVKYLCEECTDGLKGKAKYEI
ncbi:hypothetical protein LCGC14_1395680 [marine sediment metagenome]|uniref:Uncharacterized protein n=1 Tax=marine sediment metagenome TaxID=412755 RepID=A0A0F9KJK8_9ZZZZ